MFFLQSLDCLPPSFWYDEIFTMLIARLPDTATLWRALANAADVLPPTSFCWSECRSRARPGGARR